MRALPTGLMNSMMISAAIEEARAIGDQEITVAGTEEILAALWQMTFTQVSAVHELWMEAAFIKRGRGIVETVYPDPAERKRLYAYGYSPHVGRRFERVAATIRAILARAQDYAALPLEEKLSIFIDVGSAVADDGGYGFLSATPKLDEASTPIGMECSVGGWECRVRIVRTPAIFGPGKLSFRTTWTSGSVWQSVRSSLEHGPKGRKTPSIRLP